MQACRSKVRQDLATLIVEEAGLELDVQGADGETALMYACRNNNKRLVGKLIEKKADLNIKNKDEETVLIIACISEKRQEIAEILISSDGIDLDMQNKNEETALILGCIKNNEKIVKKLLEKGANIRLQDKYGETAISLTQNKYREKIREQILKHTDIKQYRMNKFIQACIDNSIIASQQKGVKTQRKEKKVKVFINMLSPLPKLKLDEAIEQGQITLN